MAEVDSSWVLAASLLEGDHRAWIVIAVLVAAVAVFLIGYYLREASRKQIDSLAVLPFINDSGDVEKDYLSDGITESLIDSLTRLPRLKVKPQQFVIRYKGKDIDARQIGNELGVTALVLGRVLLRGDRLELSAKLTNVRNGVEIWRQQYGGRATDIISLLQQLAADIAGRVQAQLSSLERQQIAKQETCDPEAYDLYLRGRFASNRHTPEELGNAITFFKQAVARDPGFVHAYSALADAYGVLPTQHGGLHGTPEKGSGESRAQGVGDS